MGWGRTLLLGDWGNRMDIGDCEQDIQSLQSQLAGRAQETRGLAEQAEVLRAENGELKLYVAALVRLLVAKSVFTKEEFAQLVDVIDRSDGTADGQFRGTIG